jgi:hypothetical protein
MPAASPAMISGMACLVIRQRGIAASILKPFWRQSLNRATKRSIAALVADPRARYNSYQAGISVPIAYNIGDMNSRSSEANLKRELHWVFRSMNFPVMLQFDERHRFTGLVIFKPQKKLSHGRKYPSRNRI